MMQPNSQRNLNTGQLVDLVIPKTSVGETGLNAGAHSVCCMHVRGGDWWRLVWSGGVRDEGS